MNGCKKNYTFSPRSDCAFLSKFQWDLGIYLIVLMLVDLHRINLVASTSIASNEPRRIAYNLLLHLTPVVHICNFASHIATCFCYLSL